MRWVGILSLLSLPFPLFAAVSFSEVAWMGSLESANHEWIELHNDSSAIDVNGWTLSDGMNLQITLEGTIPASSYVVLERTNDVSAPGSAFMIYTGALVNTGATLTLRRADGSLVDQVNGGENWQNIGGDNVTKETAQYTTRGWITAAATPALPNNTTDTKADTDVEEADETTTNTPAQSTTKKSSQETVRLQVPDVTLQLDIDSQIVGYVNQPIRFTVQPSGVGESLIDSLQYQWNFGDGNTSVLKEPIHSFAFPGSYVVTLSAQYKRQQQVARHEITILPVALSITQNTQGDLQLNNDSPYELDISGYRLRGDTEFVFPNHSIILPNQTITISKNRVVSQGQSLVVVYDTAGALVASLMPPVFAHVSLRTNPSFVTGASVPSTANTMSLSQPKKSDQPAFVFAPAQIPEKSEGEVGTSLVQTIEEPEPRVSTQEGTEPRDTQTERWTYVALVCVLLLGIFGIYAAPRRNESA